MVKGYDIEVIFKIMNNREEIGQFISHIRVKKPEDFLASVMAQIPVKKCPSREVAEAEARLFGFPVIASPNMPPNRGVAQTQCACGQGEIMADGGFFLHIARKHTMIFSFGDGDAINQDSKTPGEDSAAAPSGDI